MPLHSVRYFAVDEGSEQLRGHQWHDLREICETRGIRNARPREQLPRSNFDRAISAEHAISHHPVDQQQWNEKVGRIRCLLLHDIMRDACQERLDPARVPRSTGNRSRHELRHQLCSDETT